MAGTIQLEESSPSPLPNEFPTPPLYGCPNVETASRNVLPQEREHHRPVRIGGTVW